MSADSRISVLDGLRTWAILLVMLRHAVKPFWLDMQAPFLPLGPIDLGWFFVNGWVGVDLFFVLSGFLISSYLLRGFDKHQRFKPVIQSYAPRRFFRIAPIYYVILTIAVLGLFPFYPYPETNENLGWRYIYHLLFMQDYLPSDIIVVFWSLAIEIKYYLIAPFIIFALWRLKSENAKIFLLVLFILMQPFLRLLAAVDSDNYEDYFFQIRTSFHLCLDGLLMGTLAGFLWHSEKIKGLIEQKWIATSLFLIGLVAFFAFMFSGNLTDFNLSHFDQVWLIFWISLCFMMMLLGLMGGAVGHQLFSFKWMTGIALISYSLYLVHLPLLYSVDVMVLQFVNLGAVSSLTAFMIYWPAFLTVCIFVATLCYILVEKPVIDWSKKKYTR